MKGPFFFQLKIQSPTPLLHSEFIVMPNLLLFWLTYRSCWHIVNAKSF